MALRSDNHSIEVSLEELVTLFEQEAALVCLTEREAGILAAVALSNFLNTYGRNIVVTT